MNALLHIKLEDIQDNPYQPRTVDDAEHIEKLARSIAAEGLLQRPTGRYVGPNGTHQLAFGHSRRKAFEWLKANWKAKDLPERYDGYTTMPVEVTDLSDEEMYRHAVTENVQRKDLSPTDLARSLKQYMEQFGATSKQAGELFGMNEATVRGTVRLLDLPRAAQEALDAGKISQGTARTILSVQKFAPEAVIKDVIKKIEQNREKMTPDEVIEHAVDRLEHVQEMWGSYRDGKPRAGHHLWLLDMKNFPNKSLPVLDDTKGLSAEQVEHLVNPPACTACPFYTKLAGTHYCGVKRCHERKTAAWMAHTLEQASKNLGIAVYSKADGQARVLGYGDKALFDKRHADLRLVAKSKVPGYHYQSGYDFKGINDDIFLVVATGDALNKLQTTSTGKTVGKKTEKEKAEARAMRVYRLRRKELMWEYSGVAMSLFDNLPFPVLDQLEGGRYVGVDDRIPEEYQIDEDKVPQKERTEYKKRELAWSLIVDASTHYSREKLANQLEEMQDLVPVKLPKSLITQVAEWDAEIEAAAKPVSAETPQKPSGKGTRK